jgi:hypothetical protein
VRAPPHVLHAPPPPRACVPAAAAPVDVRAPRPSFAAMALATRQRCASPPRCVRASAVVLWVRATRALVAQRAGGARLAQARARRQLAAAAHAWALGRCPPRRHLASKIAHPPRSPSAAARASAAAAHSLTRRFPARCGVLGCGPRCAPALSSLLEKAAAAAAAAAPRARGRERNICCCARTPLALRTRLAACAVHAPPLRGRSARRRRSQPRRCRTHPWQP